MPQNPAARRGFVLYKLACVKKGGCYNLDMENNPISNFNKPEKKQENEEEQRIRWNSSIRDVIREVRFKAKKEGKDEKGQDEAVQDFWAEFRKDVEAEKVKGETEEGIQAEFSNVTKIDDWKARKNDEDEL